VVPRARICFFFLAVLASWSVAHAQGRLSHRRELHGQIEHEDGTYFREVALVKVEDERGGMGRQVQTDTSGRFDVVALEKGRYTVTVSCTGYRNEVTQVDLETVPRADVRITMHALAPATAPSALQATISVNDLKVPRAAQNEFEKGRSLLLDKHKPGDSVAHFQKALQIAPSYSQASLLLGTAYSNLGQWSDAESAFRAAISSNDKLGMAYLELGGSLIQQEKFADAEQPLLKGLELNPDSSHGYYDLGRAYYSLKRFQEAEPQARKAIVLEPNFPEAHILLGNVLLRLRNGSGALAEFQEYLRLAPNGNLAAPIQDLVKRLKAALATTN
jgi:Flp pilus assembly protein TadD